MLAKLSNLILIFGQRFGFDAAYYLRHGAWSLLGEISKMVSGTILAIIFARLADVEVFGQYQFVFSVIALLEAFSIQGFNQVIVRDTAQGNDGTYLAVVSRRKIWGALAGLLLLFAAAYFFWVKTRKDEATSMAIGAVLLPFFWSWRSWIYFWRGKKRFDLAARYLFWQSIIILFVLIPVIYFSPKHVTPIFTAYLIVQTATCGWWYFISRRSVANNIRSDDWERYGYFLSFNGLLRSNIRRIDKVIIGALFSPTLLAIYTVALVLPEKIMQLMKELLETTLPAMHNWQRLRWREIIWALLLGLLLAILTVLSTQTIIFWVFGDKYADATNLAYVAAGGLTFYPLMQLINNFAVMKAKRRSLQLAATLGPVIRLLLLVILTIRFGVLGLVILFALVPLVQSVVMIIGLRFSWRSGLS